VQKNQLYYGDNLAVLREHIKDESVDLIYLDPPFNSRQDYNVLFAEKKPALSGVEGTAPAPAPRSWPSKTPGSGTWTPKPPIRKSVERGGRVLAAAYGNCS